MDTECLQFLFYLKIMVPFKTYFDVETVKRYHKVVESEHVKELLEYIWPKNERNFFCHSKPFFMQEGQKLDKRIWDIEHWENKVQHGCMVFRKFWDYNKIQFTGAELYGNVGLPMLGSANYYNSFSTSITGKV